MAQKLLSTRRARTGIKPICKLLVADDFRAEASGKVTAVGLFADSVVVVNAPAEAPAPTPELPVGIDSLGILVNISGLEGKHRVSLSFGAYARNAAPMTTDALEYDFPSAGSSINLISAFRPLLVQSYGMKTVKVHVDDCEETLQFEVRRGAVTESSDRFIARNRPSTGTATQKRPVRKSKA